MGETHQLALFRKNLPRKPYCTDDLGGLQIRSVSHAAQKRYIQPNHPNSRLWLLFDIDRPTGPEELTDDLLLPCPTLWVQNPANNHAHALYALDVPIHMNARSSLAAIRYAGAVDVALSKAMDADPGYAGLICKNPLNAHWRTYSMAGKYSLDELADSLDLTAFNDRRRHLPEIGLGRNVRLFEQLRRWSYRAIRQGWPDFDQWHRACGDRALMLNSQFGVPLDTSEVAHIARSVSKWTHSHLSSAGFSQWQAVQGQKGGRSKGKALRDKLLPVVLDMLNEGKRLSDIARATGQSRQTISNWVRRPIV